MGLKKYLSAKNIAALAASPFTAGASLALFDYDDGQNILGELTGANSAKRANEANIANQNYWNEKNIQLQKETNEKSIELSNTAHQREMQDLENAGINRVLTAGGSGATTPNLGTAQLNAPTVENTMPGGYLAQIGQVANIANLANTAKQASASAGLQKAQAAKTAVDTAYAPQIAKSEIAKNLADAENATSSKNLNNIMGQVNQMVGDAQTQKALAETGLITKDTKGRITFNAINAGANALNGVANVLSSTKGMNFNPMTINSAKGYPMSYTPIQMNPGFTPNIPIIY